VIDFIARLYVESSFGKYKFSKRLGRTVIKRGNSR